MNINALITLYSRDELFIVSTSLHLVYIYAYDLQNSCSAQAFVKRQTSEAYTYIVFSKII